MYSVGGGIPSVGSVKLYTFGYTNALTNSSQVSSNFTDYSTVDSDYITKPQGGSFKSSTNGLQLISTNPNYVEGLVAYNKLLEASNNWTITIKSHISAFTNNQTNPFYCAGISLAKTSLAGVEVPNRVDLNLLRTGISGSKLSNSIVSGLYINNGESDTVTNKNLTDVYLRLNYTASNKTVASSYSTNVTNNYITIKSYNLGTSWNLTANDKLTLAIAASDQPDGRVIPNYNVVPGQIYLKNLTVVGSNNTEDTSVSASGFTTTHPLTISSYPASFSTGIPQVNNTAKYSFKYNNQMIASIIQISGPSPLYINAGEVHITSSTKLGTYVFAMNGLSNNIVNFTVTSGAF